MENSFGQSAGALCGGEILKFLRGALPPENLFFYGRTDSTNTRAERVFLEGAPEKFAVVAASQSEGRGRFERKWEDSPGSSVCASVGFNLEGKSARGLERFGLLAGIEEAKALREISGANLMVKWPNDIYFGSKKLSGMIAKAGSKNGKISSLIFGIGVNVSKIRDGSPWADLASASGGAIDINLVAAKVIDAALRAFERLERGEDFDLPSEFAPFDFLKGRRLCVDNFAGKVSGVACGVDGDGSLILKKDDGNICLCFSGEASILKDF
ncbi:MAG: biotin--[acetyl-CoA-carboxylase] ligase [Opitutales bacterium]|nr:biotin--[acetyl-CoA-carboxylase] ligase [Opitutales bacterium]